MCPNTSSSGIRPVSSSPLALMLSHLPNDPSDRQLTCAGCRGRDLLKTAQTVSWIICLSSREGEVHTHVLCDSHQSQQDGVSPSSTALTSMIYRHLAGSQLRGTPNSAQNINTPVSARSPIKGRVRVGWLKCCADAWLRVVNQEGETSPGLCDVLIRTSLCHSEKVYTTLNYIKGSEPRWLHLIPRICIWC